MSLRERLLSQESLLIYMCDMSSLSKAFTLSHARVYARIECVAHSLYTFTFTFTLNIHSLARESVCAHSMCSTFAFTLAFTLNIHSHVQSHIDSLFTLHIHSLARESVCAHRMCSTFALHVHSHVHSKYPPSRTRECMRA